MRQHRRRDEIGAAASSDLTDAAALADQYLGLRDWQTLPAGARRWTFQAPSGPLAALSAGPEEGWPVLLLPGVTGSKEDFSLMLPLLADAGYSVHAIDLAGQYESSDAGPERAGRYDNELFVRDVLAVLTSVGSAHVLGYSFAGIVAQIAAIRQPELFRSLALLSSPPLAGNSFRGLKSFGSVARLRLPRVAAALMIWGVRNNLHGADEARAEFARHRFALTDRGSVVDVMRLMMHVPDLRSEVASLPIPKLVAVGRHDFWREVDHDAYAAAIGAEFVEYDTGHSPCETTPHQLCRDLLRLYAKADSPSR